MKLKSSLIAFLLLFFSGLFSPTVLASEDKAVAPSDVLARVNLSQQYLNLIAKAMGKKIKLHQLLIIKSASSREVYFEAQAMYKKSSALAYEVAKTSSLKTKVPGLAIRSEDVLDLVEASLNKIILIKEELDIKTELQASSVSSRTTSAQVFNAILETNQMLNNLLYKQVEPSAVFAEVTVALNYIQAILGHQEAENEGLNLPLFVPNKTPSDVYQRLIECIDALKAIASKSQVRMLDFTFNQKNLSEVKPSDVYDLSKVIVSESRYLATLELQNKTPNFDSYYPGYKTPSDVFQRASLLLLQIKKLNRLANQNKKWMKVHEAYPEN